jgi:hypothetical protein
MITPRDHREHHAVGQHDRHKDEEKWQIEHHRDGSASDELADVLDTAETGGNHPGRPRFEVTGRELQDVLEHRRAEHRIDPIAGVQDEVLPQPGEETRENDEDTHAGGNHNERALRLVHDNLVDDHLRKERRSERQELDEEGGDQHVPPDRLVLQELRYEPAEAERTAGARGSVRILERRRRERRVKNQSREFPLEHRRL